MEIWVEKVLKRVLKKKNIFFWMFRAGFGIEKWDEYARIVIESCYRLIKHFSTGLLTLLSTLPVCLHLKKMNARLFFDYFLNSSRNRLFMASFSSPSSRMKSLITSSKARSAFCRIWALPARSPEERSVLGSSCLLKFPSLMGCSGGGSEGDVDCFVDKFVEWWCGWVLTTLFKNSLTGCKVSGFV